MAIETEIKLQTTLEGLQALRQSTVVAKLQKDTAWQTKQLNNQYFDTPDCRLAHSAVALRIRQDGQQLIQTLKTRGQSVAGLAARNEWEWPLTSEQLDLTRLDDSCWPIELNDLDKTQLQPIFRTDFSRELLELAFDYEGQPVVIELALDQGQVTTAQGSEAICEVELELRQGPAVALLIVAQQLAAEVVLLPCDVSKAERGYRLLGAEHYALRLAKLQLTQEQNLDQTIAACSGYLLGNSQRLAEHYRFTGQWKLFEQWLQQVAHLKAFLSSLGLAAPRKTTAHLRQQLESFIAQWQSQNQAGTQQQSVREQVAASFNEWLQQPAWGQFVLAMALWIEQQAWQVGRNAKGQRQGQALLVNWLSHFLQDELQALSVTDYLREPQRINEQQPRLARILVWLELAREQLPLAEIDQLLGSLRAIYSLSQTTEQWPSAEAAVASDELEQVVMTPAAQLIERLIELRRLSAWKQLVK